VAAAAAVVVVEATVGTVEASGHPAGKLLKALPVKLKLIRIRADKRRADRERAERCVRCP